ncbi:hypothetical protein, partial [Pantoea sp. Pa-EAmG]|uniref:hypothetical protein n=1 Tax=Pantoea sp. Pa-EAmG TaxID=3043311 RepID=UPI0024AFC818
QLTFNQLVAGSNPARPTSYVERRPKGAFLLFYEVRYVALRSYSGQIRRGGLQRNLTSLWIGLAIHGSDASLLRTRLFWLSGISAALVLQRFQQGAES